MTKTKKYFIFGTNKKFIILFMMLKKLKCLYVKIMILKKWWPICEKKYCHFLLDFIFVEKKIWKEIENKCCRTLIYYVNLTICIRRKKSNPKLIIYNIMFPLSAPPTQHNYHLVLQNYNDLQIFFKKGCFVFRPFYPYM